MARKPREQRNAEQRLRQKVLRDLKKDKRRPDRDDFGRLLLWMLVSRQIEHHDTDDAMAEFRDILVGHLVEQGFDEREADDVWDGLLIRYASVDNPFRRKLHLDIPGQNS